MNNWTLDMAVRTVVYEKSEVRITIANLGKLVMPSVVEVTFVDGTRRTVPLPAETWIKKRPTSSGCRAPLA